MRATPMERARRTFTLTFEVAALAFAALLEACSCGDDEEDDAGRPTDGAVDASSNDGGSSADAGNDAGEDAAPDAGPSGVGTSCIPDPEDLQGSCPDGLLCAPFAGGYCTRGCSGGTECPADAACAESHRAGELCLLSCESDAGCRQDEGYACDPDWRVCIQGGILAPIPPDCGAEPALPRSRFAPAVQISTSDGPGDYQIEPAASFLPDGRLVVASNGRSDSIGADSTIGLSTVLPGGSVDGDRTLPPGTESTFDVWMDADRSGRLHLVWLGFDGLGPTQANMRVGYASSADGEAWTEPVPIHDPDDCPDGGDECLDKPMIAIGPVPDDLQSDAIYVFYFSAVRGGMRALRSLDGGGSFPAPSVPVGVGAYGDAETDATGAIHVVYVQGSGLVIDLFGDERTSVWYVTSTDGGESFDAPIAVSGEGEPIPFYFSNPQVVADPDRGLVYVVYPTGLRDGAWDIRLATSADGGETWSSIQVNDDPHCANHMTPTLALDPTTGGVHVVWTENRGGIGRVAYAVCDSGAVACSANEEVSSEPFASYSFVRQSRKWQGEYYELLIDPSGSELHAVFTQTVDEAGLPTARIFHASAAL